MASPSNQLVTLDTLNKAFASTSITQLANGGAISQTALGTIITPTRDVNTSTSAGTVTILGGHGKLYTGHLNGQIVLVEIIDASEVATIKPGTTLLATEL